jgi:TRAP-type C4-dicarboxylate transport system substrate-binding protein
VQEAADEAMAEERASAQALADDMTAKMIEAGVAVNTPDLAPFREATKPIVEQYLGTNFPQELYDLVTAGN